MQKLWHTICTTIVWSIIAIFTVCISMPIVLHSLFYFYKLREGQILYFGIAALILAGGGILLKSSQRMTQKRINAWLLLLFIIGGIIRVIAVMNSQPEVDAAYCLQSAMSAAKGEFSWADDTYFQQWGYQIPLVLFEAAILRVFGSVNAIHAMNVLASLITGYCLYRIADELTADKGIATGVAGMFLLLPSNAVRLGNPYNQTISAMFAMLGVLLWIGRKARQPKRMGSHYLARIFGAGLMLGLGKLFRSDGIILIIAIVCCQALDGLYKLSHENIRKLWTSTVEILVLLAAYCTIVNAVDWAVIASGINDFGIDNNCPYWAIACGLTPDNFGSYHARFSWLGSIMDKAEQQAAFWQILNEILNEMDLRSWIWFYFNKIYNMWTVEEWYFGQMEGAVLYIAKAFEKSVYFIVLNLGLVSGIARGLERKNRNAEGSPGSWFLMIAYIGFFLIYLLVESVVRYRYLAVTVLFALSAKGMQDLKRIICSISDNIKLGRDSL